MAKQVKSAPEQEVLVPSIQLVDVKTLQPIPGAEYKTSKSAGFDIAVSVSRTINPGDSFIFHTGARLLVSNWEDSPNMVTFATIQLRSSIRKFGLSSLDMPVIDLDYEGEIMLIVHNHSKNIRHIQSGTLIGQVVFMQALRPNGIPIKEAIRGDVGFGSTTK